MSSLRKFWSENKIILSFLLAVFFLFLFLIPNTTTPGKFDRRCWITWTNYINGNGFGNVYKLGVNYLPLYHYVLYIYGKLQGSTEGIIYHINSLKYVTFFFELLGLFFVYRLAKDQYKNVIVGVLVLIIIILNPAFLYDNVLYGQVDGIYATFIFASVFFGIKRSTTWSLISFVIALNLKLQSITFLPLIFFLNLDNVLEEYSTRKVLSFIWPAILLQVLFLLPFAIQGDLGKVWQVVTGSEGMYPFVSMGAYNWWYYFLDNPVEVIDTTGVFGRSFKRIGQGLYIITALLACWPFMQYFYFKYFRKNNRVEYPGISQILLMGLLMSLLFFFLNTEMHARYVHAAIIFAGAYAIYNRTYVIYVFLSIAYFLNLEDSAKILKGNIAKYENFYFQPQFVATLFLIALLLSFYQIFNKQRKLF